MFVQHSATSQYVSRTSLLIECDYLDECEQGRADETALTRLHESLLTGQTPRTADVLKNVRELEEKLSVRPSKNIVVQTTNNSMNARRSSNTFNTVILSQPYGLYYCTITLPFNVYWEKQTGDIWDGNPIDLAQIWNIPSAVKADKLRTSRLERTPHLSLHFQDSSFLKALELVSKLNLRDPGFQALELRNIDATPNQVEMLKIRLALLPNTRIVVHRPGQPAFNKDA